MTNEGVQLADELMSVNTAMRRLVRRRLREEVPPRMRPAQVELMAVVGAHPGISVAAAARELHLADNSVSTLVNQLLAAGMLRRETDPDDRRAVRLGLTPEAQRHMAAWRDRRARLVGARIEELPDDDRAAIAAALPALGRLLERLQDKANVPAGNVPAGNVPAGNDLAEDDPDESDPTTNDPAARTPAPRTPEVATTPTRTTT